MNDMLCRVSDSLFWMSRYIERAENTARIVDVNLQLLMDNEKLASKSHVELWTPILNGLGDLPFFLKRYEEPTSSNVMEFLTLNRKNPSSIFSSIYSARENARMIRDQISDEMWEIVNRLYHHIRKASDFGVGSSELYKLLKLIKEYSHLFSGLTESTFPHRVGYEFIKAGRFIEMADKTGRILASQPSLEASEEEDAADLTRWGAVLRATSSLSAYQQQYSMGFKPDNIFSLLIFSREFPRSMLFALYQLQSAIHAISGCPVSHYSNEAERICGRLISEMSYTSVFELHQIGLMKFLDRASHEIEAIAFKLSDQYMFFPVIDPAADAA